MGCRYLLPVTFREYMTFCRSVLAEAKCGEAQAGTPAQRLAAVVRWAASAENDEAFKVYLLKFINYKMNYCEQKILNRL